MKHTVTLIPGDGIGPEVSNAVKNIIAAAGVEIIWEEKPRRAATSTAAVPTPFSPPWSIRSARIASR
jgi:isocitrate dehydrogenase (NAD+)